MKNNIVNIGPSSQEIEEAATPREKIVVFLKSPAGFFRVSETIFSLLAIIFIAVGYCGFNAGYHGFIMFVLIITFIEALLISIGFAMRLQEKLTSVNLPLSLLVNDGILLVFYFIAVTLALLQIGGCSSGVASRIIGALFVIGVFLLLIGLCYFNLLLWQHQKEEKASDMSSGTTVTNDSPTVLT